ncbi:hypothetical protein H7I41_11025 [Mycobacterium manitobense]|uniref:Uncharacterized protein n=1 Tax=[Mycobacterium] manitobense TaxID=190147 RepID=A0A9X3BWH7_9MYCO|nr:hypothetical protein [[Mycobacterium] manitobense]MCV7170447.1 hypothetical protein [[Mycobacterium] manitobense]
MLTDVWTDYWWVLLPLLYFAVLVVLIRRGLWATVGQMVMLGSLCALILYLPFSHPPMSYVLAVLTVLDLLLFVQVNLQPLSRGRGRHSGAAEG